jgi:hypothetical protein
MSVYQIYDFDGVALPLYEPTQDLSTGTVDSTLLASVGGTFDVWSGYQRQPRSTKTTITGIYEGTDGSVYLIDEVGNYVSDEVGNHILAASAAQYLRQQVDAIRAKVGVAGPLGRRRWDDTTIAQWKTARLLGVQQRSDIQHRTTLAGVDCTFESAMANWRDATVTTASATLAMGGTAVFVLSSDGNATVEDAIITITTGGYTLSSVSVVIATAGVDLEYTTAIGPGGTLVINCGTQSVTESGVGAYSGFALGAGHTARGWMPLAPGQHVVEVASTGFGSSPGTVSIAHYDQWV